MTKRATMLRGASGACTWAGEAALLCALAWLAHPHPECAGRGQVQTKQLPEPQGADAAQREGGGCCCARRGGVLEQRQRRPRAHTHMHRTCVWSIK
jgi:hypothetical protein